MPACFGPFSLDTATRQLYKADRELHLSPKAFDLLATLIAHRPAVVDKATLRERLWPGTNVVDANLNNLASEIRSVLDDDAQEPRYVRTAHGVGYAFCAVVIDEEGRAAGPVASSARDRHPRAWLTWNDRMFPLDEAVSVIGRDPESAIWVDAIGVSRRHASIRRSAAGGIVIEDLGSTNGTFVGGRRVRDAVALTDGQSIQIGEAALTFRAPVPLDAPTKRIKKR